MNQQQLRDRTKEFAATVVRLCGTLPKEWDVRELGKQLLRSGTAVAANYRACGRARSDKEFCSKLGIVVEVFGLPPGQLHALLEQQFSVQFDGKTFSVYKLEGLPVDISTPSRLLSDHGSVPGLIRQADPDMDIDEALARRVDRQRIAVPCGHDRMRLHLDQRDGHVFAVRGASQRCCGNVLGHGLWLYLPGGVRKLRWHVR